MKYKFKTEPYAHQLSALEKSWDKDEYAYFMEMGTGKSKVLVDNVAMLYDKGKINAALIIAPKGVYRNWYSQEIPNHLAGHIDHKTILWTATTSKAKDKEYQQLFKPDLDLHILIMNVEAFSTKKGLEFATKFLNCHKTIMAIDESTTIKTPTAKRTKAILNLGKLAKYRRILTGSPVTKSPLDLYTQCGFLDEELLGFSSFYTFRNRYAVMVDRSFGGRRVQIPAGYRRLDELSEILKKFSDRVLKQDCLDLPEKTYVERQVELTEDQKKTHIKINFQVMIDLIRFSMDNAICKLGGECFIRQTTGIPQGDSLSPAVCIGTCGWYEMKWMQNWSPEDNKLFQIRRYLDDVNMIFKTNSPRATAILEEFQKKGSCYPEDLSLEGEKDNSEYLETNIIYDADGSIMCKHRNKNEGCGAQQIFYKGKHAHSYSERKHKMGAMIGTCYRIQRNSFSDDLLIQELREKTREWQECLKYTPKFVLSAIKYLANKHVEGVWTQAHKALLGDSV